MKIETQKKAEIIADFINFCKEALDIESLPKIQFISDNTWAKNNRSFGQYNIMTKSLIVYIGNRNLADICRTLSHELVHHKQNELGQLDNMSGETGSDTENQANSIAGICLRNYGKIEPLIYESKNKVTNNGKRNKSKKGIL
jgi:Zn-dependent peptidase ImmA (M78 family)